MAAPSAAGNYALFVGRVGALAVALGIGVAIADSPAIASAETGTSSSGASADGSKADSSSPVRGPRKPSFGDGKGLTARLVKVSERRSSAGSIETAVGNARQAVSRAITAATDAPRNRRATLDTRSQAALDPAVVAPAPIKSLTNDVVNQLVPALAPRIQTLPAPARPVSPVQDLSLAAMLGWSRRQGQPAPSPIERSITTSETVSNLTSEVTTDAAGTLATPQQLKAEQQVRQIVNRPVVQLAKMVLMAAWYVEAVKNFSAVGGPDLTNLVQLHQAATEYANQSATEFLLLNSNDPKLLLQVNPPHNWAGQYAGGTRIWYDNPDTVYRFTGINGASTYKIEGTVQGYDPADPSTHPTSSNANFSVLTGINGVTAANLSGQDLSVRDDGTFTIIVSPNPAPANPEKGMNYLRAPSNSTILATRNTLSDWNTDTPMKLTIERIGGPPNSLFSQFGGFAIPIIGPTVVENPLLLSLVSIIPAMKHPPVFLQAAETAVLMLVTGITGEDTYMSVATATGRPNTLSQPAHNAQFLSTQLQSAGYFQLKDDEAMIITVHPGAAEYFVVPVTNDWTITNNTRDQQTSLNNSQAIKNADGSYTIVVSKQDPGVANWVSTGGLNQGTISMRFQGVDPNSTNTPTVTTRVVKVSELQDIVTDSNDPNYNPEQLNYDRADQIAKRQAGYDRRYTV